MLPINKVVKYFVHVKIRNMGSCDTLTVLRKFVYSNGVHINFKSGLYYFPHLKHVNVYLLQKTNLLHQHKIISAMLITENRQKLFFVLR